MRIRTNSETIAHLVDQVAALDDAPDRSLCEWFYADLARLAADAIDDYIAQELVDELTAEQRQEAYNQGHDAGYDRGLHDARRRATQPATTLGGHRSANRTGGPAIHGRAHRPHDRGRRGGA